MNDKLSTINLIDTHAHLYYKRFKEDFDEVIQHALGANLKYIINIGADLESSQQSVNLESSKIQFYSSIGLHPHEVTHLNKNNSTYDESIHECIEELEKMYHSNTTKVVAIGECGLDYFFENNPDGSPSLLSEAKQVGLQEELFKAQINLAKELNLPLIIHCRDGDSASSLPSAWQDIFIPELSGTKGAFHSFTSTMEDAQKALDLGYYLSFSCIVTYPKNEYLRQIIKNMPLDKILTETDCPFLPPQSQRGQRNEPANVVEVVKVISEMKNISFEEAVNQTLKNAKKLFKLL